MKPLPQCVASESDVYWQSKNCQYFQGVSPRIFLGVGRKGIVVIANPKNSSVNLYIDKVNISNYSNSPIMAEGFVDAQIDGDLQSVQELVPCNMSCIGKVTPSGRLFYGSNIRVEGRAPVYAKPIPPFTSLPETLGGSIIIPPGKIRTYVLQTICSNETAIASMGFYWWEECI